MNIEHPFDLYHERGESLYGGEAVTQLQHGLQAAAAATAEGAEEALIVAALLHDVGHLLNPASETASEQGRDLKHEKSGARFLARWFGPEVTEPIALHVDAKRYLARDETYRRSLSGESQRTLELQGGPMSDAEAAFFRSCGGFEGALALRRWDDAAKVEDWQGPDLESYRAMTDRVARDLQREVEEGS